MSSGYYGSIIHCKPTGEYRNLEIRGESDELSVNATNLSGNKSDQGLWRAEADGSGCYNPGRHVPPICRESREIDERAARKDREIRDTASVKVRADQCWIFTITVSQFESVCLCNISGG